ncbi:hypothetical protein ACJMK2_002090, partial [Sinanodonta woodiana]
MGKASKTQNATCEAVEFNLPTTSTHPDTSANEQPITQTVSGAVKKFIQPLKKGKILEVTSVPTLA